MAYTITALAAVGVVLPLLLARRVGCSTLRCRGAARRRAAPLTGPFLPGPVPRDDTASWLVPFSSGSFDGGGMLELKGGLVKLN